ncbi:MAG: hypothetical protein ACLUE8_06945 [Lachnospiraceae bacterium]
MQSVEGLPLGWSEAVNAFSCWLSLHTNRDGPASCAWMETVPDETVEFCTLNRYLYMAKICGYIALGKHTDALALLQRMLLYADYAHRNLYPAWSAGCSAP